MKNTPALLALLLQFIASIAVADGDLVVSGGWIRAAPPNAPVLAGYVTIENRSPRGQSLVGAASPAFGDVTIHRTEHTDGVVRMTHLPSIDITAHGKLVLQPDGYHLMLMQPKRPLRTGDRVPVELRFADGSRTSALFAVRDRGAAHEDRGSHTDHKSMAHDRPAR